MRIRWLSLVVILLVFGSACSRDPNIAKRKYLESGNKYFDKGKYKEASIMYRSALKKDVRYGEAYYRLGLTALKLKDPSTAERSLRRAFDLLRPGRDKDDVTTRLADLYLAVYLGDTRRSKAYEIELKDYAGRLPEKSFERLRLEAYVAWKNADLDTALAKFGAANQVKPMDSNLILAYVQVLAAKNQFDAAEKLARDLIAKDKAYGPIYETLYLEYARRNRAADAEQMRKLKVENNPKVIDYRMQLAAHYFLMQRRDEAARVIDAMVADRAAFPQGQEKAGDFYMTFREFDKAIAYYRSGLGGSKEHRLSAQRKIADALVAQNKKDQALALVENEILKENPKDALGLALRATLWLEMGNRSQVQQAVSELESSVSRLPQNAVVRYNLGRAYWTKGDVEQARVQFRAALDIQPDYLAPQLALAQIQLSKGEFAAAIQMTNATLAISPGNSVARMLRASALKGVGKPDEARAELELILRNSPDSGEARFRLGVLELGLKNFPSAERAFQQCLHIPTNNITCLVGLAEVYTAQKQFDKAIKMLDAEQAKDPGKLEIRRALGNTYAIAGRFDQAAKIFSDLLIKDPASSDLHLRLAEAYRRMGNVDLAIQHFRKVKELNPNNPEAAVWLALLLHQTGKQAEAKAQYEQILRLQPDNPVALNNLAYVLAEQGGDLDVALTYAQRAKQKLPQSFDVADTLGWIYIKKNLTSNAVDIYNDLVGKQPGNATYRLHLGMALFQKGDKPRARQELETALRSKPSSADAGRIKELLQRIG
jgi:tetratricopeptide (TPR) repeat protein